MHADRKWYHFVNPIMLLILYYTLATLIRLWLQEPLDQLTVRAPQGEVHTFAAKMSRIIIIFFFNCMVNV